jgi:hypothetical protein
MSKGLIQREEFRTKKSPLFRNRQRLILRHLKKGAVEDDDDAKSKGEKKRNKTNDEINKKNKKKKKNSSKTDKSNQNRHKSRNKGNMQNASKNSNKSKKKKKLDSKDSPNTKQSPKNSKNIIDLLSNPYEAGVQFRQTLDRTLKLGITKPLTSEQKSIYYFDDRFLESSKSTTGDNRKSGNNISEGAKAFVERKDDFLDDEFDLNYDLYSEDNDYIPEVLVIGKSKQLIRRSILFKLMSLTKIPSFGTKSKNYQGRQVRLVDL